ncbi:MAG: RidA family protein [Devosia sp.]
MSDIVTSPNGAIFYAPARPYPISRTVRAGDFVYTSALGDRVRSKTNDPLGDGPEAFDEEARGTFRAIAEALQLAGASLADVVDCQVWLREPENFEPMNRIFREFFTETQPVRSVFQNVFMFNFRIELKVVAYAPAGR